MYSEILYEVRDRLATITLSRPERLNAWTPVMTGEFLDCMDCVDSDDEVRALIVTGEGRAFCSGADMQQDGFGEQASANPMTAPLDEDALASIVPTAPLRIFECSKPVIGAINGPAVGVGMTLALPMDVRLASGTARFGLPYVRRALAPEAGMSWFLPRVVGVSQALEWTISGRVFDAQEALAAGLVRGVHAPDELLPAARALAVAMTESSSPVAVAMARRLVWRMVGRADPYESYRAELRCLGWLGAQPDAVEGVVSFLEKRPPRFTGRPSVDVPMLDELLATDEATHTPRQSPAEARMRHC